MALRVFKPTRYAWPKPGVRAQYREAKKKNAGHLYEMESGRMVIHHRDRYNPDAGPLYAIGHLGADVLGFWGTLAAIAGGALLFSALRKKAKNGTE